MPVQFGERALLQKTRAWTDSGTNSDKDTLLQGQPLKVVFRVPNQAKGIAVKGNLLPENTPFSDLHPFHAARPHSIKIGKIRKEGAPEQFYIIACTKDQRQYVLTLLVGENTKGLRYFREDFL